MSPKKKEDKTFASVLLGAYLDLKSRLPLKYHYFWGDVFAWILRIFHYRYDVMMINLARSFPDKKYKELQDIAQKTYTHFGEILAESIWYRGNKGEKGRKRLHDQQIVRFTNPEAFNAFYAQCPGGVMTLNTHSGNWEIIGGFFQYNYSPEDFLMKPEQIAVVHKRLHSKTWDILMERNRCITYTDMNFEGYVESEKILRYAVQHRRDQLVYVFITDQHPYKGAASTNIGPFMHQETRSMIGGAALASRFGMGVAYVRWQQVNRGQYELSMIPMYENAAGVSETEIMQKFHSLLEEDLNKQPWNYLWTHKRWK